MSETVLDASALIAYLKQERGAEAVAPLLPDAVISAVNMAEVVTRMAEDGFSPEQAREIVANTSLDLVAFDEALAIAAGLLRASTRHLGLSLGDRACLALAARLGVPALTADRRWGGLDVGVEIRQIRS